jgi:F-type H+-transporting ATPase subunit b
MPIQKLPTDVMQVSEQMILLTWIVFGIAAVCLHKLLWKPILRTVETREKSISDALDGAEEARKQLRESESRGRQVVTQAIEEARTLADQANREKSALLARADQEARALAKRRVADAEREIEVEQRKATEAVRLDAAKNVGELVERLLRGNITDEQKRAYQTDILGEVKL